jgi:hypothetical protein
MGELSKKERRSNVLEVLGNCVREGLEPDSDSFELMGDYIEGHLTWDEIGKVMEKLRKEDRRYDVDQAIASCALEGFEPDKEYLELMDKGIKGVSVIYVFEERIT